MKQKILNFFFPELTRPYLVRILVTALIAVCVFKFILIPIRITGSSMEPAYKNGGFNFCFKLRYLFKNPERFDVVGIRMTGEKVILLKRVVAAQGEVVEIKHGVLYINGTKTDEPHLKYPSDWNLTPRKVKPNHVYVIGDNRSVPMSVHSFGQTPMTRIAGGPLW